MARVKVDTRAKIPKMLPVGGKLRRNAYWLSTTKPIFGYLAFSRDGYRYRWVLGRGYIGEHRLVAEAALGRRLRRGEVVHHIDGSKVNNSPRNLLVCDRPYHRWLHERCLARYGHWHLPRLRG